MPPPDSSKVTLILYSVNGTLVDTLVNGLKPQGEHEFFFQGPMLSSLSAGIYFYRLTVGDTTTTKKIVLLK